MIHVRKTLLTNVSLLLASCLVGLGIVELGCRLFVYRTHTFDVQYLQSVRHLRTATYTQPSPVENISYTLKPNINILNHGVPIQTNTFGLRDKSYTLQKPKQTVRVAVLGDSYTLPRGVAIEDAYHSIMEERFNQKFTDVQFEFINFGVSAYSLIEYNALVAHVVPTFEPDLILLGFCGRNDQNVQSTKRRARIVIPSESSGAVFKPAFMKVINHIVRARRRDRWQQREIPANKVQAQQTYLQEQLTLLAKQANAPVVVAAIDTRPLHAHVKHTLETLTPELGLEFVDITAAFPELQRQHFVSPIDTHPNAKAHRIFADELYTYLEQSPAMRQAIQAQAKVPKQ